MIKTLLLIAVVVGFGYIVMYNKRLLNFLGASRERSEGVFYRILGKRVRKWNVQIERSANVKSDTRVAKINNYFKDIIINLDMSKDNVTPIGLLTFITTLSIAFATLYILWSGETWIGIFAFAAIFYFIVVLFRFMSLIKFEKREAEIMDTEDLIAMDIKGGVQNAITRYSKSFHPTMRPYFEDFLDNIRNKGYSFKDAMLLLNSKLGSTFTSFAQKAIMYESKASADMEDIFSAVIEVNRYKRTLREENNRKFNDLRIQFVVSVLIIAGYGVFSVWSDPFLARFFMESDWGKLVLLADLVTVTAVLGYISSIKAKFIG